MVVGAVGLIDPESLVDPEATGRARLYRTESGVRVASMWLIFAGLMIVTVGYLLRRMRAYDEPGVDDQR